MTFKQVLLHSQGLTLQVICMVPANPSFPLLLDHATPRLKVFPRVSSVHTEKQILCGDCGLQTGSICAPWTLSCSILLFCLDPSFLKGNASIHMLFSNEIRKHGFYCFTDSFSYTGVTCLALLYHLSLQTVLWLNIQMLPWSGLS